MPPDDRRQQLQLSRICIHHLDPVCLVGEHEVASCGSGRLTSSAHPRPLVFAHHVSTGMCCSHNYCTTSTIYVLNASLRAFAGNNLSSRPLAGTDSEVGGRPVYAGREIARLSHNIPSKHFSAQCPHCVPQTTSKKRIVACCNNCQVRQQVLGMLSYLRCLPVLILFFAEDNTARPVLSQLLFQMR